MDEKYSEKLVNFFKGISSVYSVYSGGSFLKSAFSKGVSDIDLSIILGDVFEEDIIKIETSLSEISDELDIKISRCYSFLNDMKKDIEKFSMHAHGVKRTTFLWDLKHGEKIYGEDLTPLLDNIEFHPYEMYSKFSPLKNDIIKSMSSMNLKKSINIAIICAKTALILHGHFRTDKYDIIKTFSQEIDEDMGNRLFKMYHMIKQGRPLVSDYQFLIDFCRFCQDKSRETFGGKIHGSIKIE